MRSREGRLLFTCEHGGHRVPRAYAELFRGRERLLASHRGWDRGALDLARALARRMDAPLIPATTTRLLVDLNRSAHNRSVFSELTRGLPPAERQALLRRHHAPHWRRVRDAIRAATGATVHVGVHSFVPRLRGATRRFTVGILYDPRRDRERRLAIAWQRELRRHLPRVEVRRNAPYRGDGDGLTTALRRELSPSRYLGLELELRQDRIPAGRGGQRLAERLEQSLRAALAVGPSGA